MRNPTDSLELRRQFAEQFLASPQDHDEVILDGPMQSLIGEFDTELAKAKTRYPTINVDAEWAEMDRWLSDHGFTETA